MLVAAAITVELPSFGTRRGSGFGHLYGGRRTERLEWSGGGTGTIPIPKGKPAPFDSFQVVATDELWKWWHQTSTMQAARDASPEAHETEEICGSTAGQHEAIQAEAGPGSENALPHTLCVACQRLVKILGDSIDHYDRHAVERGIREGIFGIHVKAVFGELLEECRRIQHEGERLEVDGCFYLYHVHLASKPSPPNRSECAKALMESGFGGVHLQSIRAAADSLVAWAGENPMTEVGAVDSAEIEHAEEGSVGDGESDQGPEQSPLELSETKRLILRAILDLKAAGESSKVTCPQVSAKVKMEPDARLRSELADLRTLRLLGGKKGQRGYWLTDAGIREARAASQSS